MATLWLIYFFVFTADGIRSVKIGPDRIAMGGRGTRMEAGEDPQEPGTPKPAVLQYPSTGAWHPVTDPQPMKRPHSYCSGL